MEQPALTHRGCRDWRWFSLITGGAALAAALVVVAGDGSLLLLKFVLMLSASTDGELLFNEINWWSRLHSLGAFGVAITLGLVVLRLRSCDDWGGRSDRPILIAATVLAVIAGGIAIALEWQLQSTLHEAVQSGGMLRAEPPRLTVPHILQWIAAVASIAALAWVASAHVPSRGQAAGKAMNVALAAVALCGLCFLASGNVTLQLKSTWNATGGQPQSGDMARTIWSYGLLDVAGWLLWIVTVTATIIGGVARRPAHASIVAPMPDPHHTASPPPPAPPADRASE